MNPTVVAKDLNMRFGNLHAVRGISLQVETSEVLGFLGPNGAGKSTTMRMITGFLDPTSGSVLINGVDLFESSLQAKRQIGYLPEGAPVYPDMTVREFLLFIAESRGYQASEARSRVELVVQKVNLENVLFQEIETLSKGFKRRVGLAQALVHDPPILILDEPTDGLDPNQKHEVRELIRSMQKEKTIILSTHILEEVDAVCNRTVVINKGLVVFDGSPRELESLAPDEVKSQRLDHVFRQLTTEKIEVEEAT